MTPPGYLYWTDDWFRLRPWLVSGFIQGLRGLTWREVSPIVRVPTHGGTQVTQRPFLGALAPMARVAFEFDASFQGVHEATYQAVRDALLSGGVVDFCPGVWARERFAAGGTFKLSRPVAWGTVPGVDSFTFPQTGAASISGQDVEMAGAGTVNYFPLFKVMVDSVGSAVEDVNGLDFSANLTECIEVD